MTDHIEIMEKDIETHVNAHLGSSAWEALKQMPKIELATYIQQWATRYIADRYNVPTEWITVKAQWKDQSQSMITIDSVIFKPAERVWVDIQLPSQ